MSTAEVDPGRHEMGSRATGRALIRLPVQTARKTLWGLGRSHGLVAGAVAVIMGVGFVCGTEILAGRAGASPAAQTVSAADLQMGLLYRVQDEVRSLRASLDGLRATAESGRQDDAVRGLKKSVDQLKQDLEGVRTASAGAVGQLGAKLDKLDRDPGPKLAEISARLDKLDHDPAPKLAEITSRIDRIERQVSSSGPTGSIAPEAGAPTKAPLPPQHVALAPTPTPPPAPPLKTALAVPAVPAAVAPAPRPEPAKLDPPKTELKADAGPHPEAPAKPATVEGWMLRDVYGGVALLEGRTGLREVAPGEYIPGVGEVRSIERRGRSWVVVTSRGIIQADNRW